MGLWSDICDWVEDKAEKAVNWVADNAKNIAMFTVAAVTIAVGICVTVLASPFIGAVAGGALIGAGVCGLMSSFSKKTTWKEFGMSMGKGFIIGAVSGLFSWGASALLAQSGLTGVSNFLLTSSVRIGAGMASSFVTNGLNNVMNGQKFTENWKSALLAGFIIGGIGAIADGLRQFNAQAAQSQADNLLTKTFDKVSQLKDKYNQVVDACFGSYNWVVHGGVEIIKTLAEGATMQYLISGEIDWKMVLIGGAIFCGTRMARSAYEYRQKQKNDKFINNAFDEHEKIQDQNVKDARMLAEEKAKKVLKEAKNNLKNTPRNDIEQRREAADKVNQVKKDLKAIRRGHPLPKKETISTCTGKLRDPEGKVHTGRNAAQRKHDGEMKARNGIPASENDQFHLENEQRDDLPHRHALHKGEEHVNQHGETVKGRAQVPMTTAEAKEKWPRGEHKNRSRGCAEWEAVVEADRSKGGKTDLNKSSMMTVGSDHDRDKYGRVLKSKHMLKPPCDKGCSSIKFEKNYTVKKDLAEQIQPGNLRGEQTFMDIRREKRRDDEEEASSSRVTSEGKPLLDNEAYSPEFDSSSSDEDSNKVTKKKKRLVNSDEILGTLEDELRWQNELKKKYDEKKEEEERLKNDDFIRNNIIRKENIYATSSTGGQGIRAGTSKKAAADEAYPAGQIFPKKKRDREVDGGDSSSHRKSKKGQTKSEKMYRTRQSIVETYPIVAWSEKHNKYMMVDHSSWPKPIKGKTKMIAFLGVHKSGRTTLLHSLIYEAGHTMTKEQSLITKVGLGINMYILRESGFIFLDICDSMDMIGDLQKDSTPIANVLLETFGYLNCDHLVYSLPFGEEAGMTTQQAINYIKSRVELLFTVSNQLLKFAGAMQITVVPRLKSINEKTCGKWRELEAHFEEMQSRIGIAKLISEGEDGTPLSDEERFGHLSEEDVLLGAKHLISILPVRFFQSGRSLNGDVYYWEELERLWKCVEKETGAHPSSLGIEEMADTTVYGCMITTWNRLIENKEITDCVTEVSNEKMMKQARGENGQDSAVDIYLKNFENYLKKVPPESSLARAINNYGEERRECSERYEKTSEEDRDPEVFLRLLLKSGTILIKECLEMTDINLKEEGLRIGLSVFSTLLGQGDKFMDIRLLRLGIVDLDLISLLNNELIYMNYHEAWVIFYFMTTRGFRFHLLEVPLWTALREILTRDGELIPEKTKIYDWSLHTLMWMMDLDEMPMLPPGSSERALDDDNKLYLSSDQRIQLDYDYRLYSEEHVQRLFTDTVNNPHNASDNYDKFIELAEKFYNDHEICTETGLLFEDLHVSCRDQFAHATLNHFHQKCAAYFAEKIFDKHVLNALKSKGKEDKLKVAVLRLKVLRTAVDVVIKDKKLLPLLAESGLHNWLLTGYLTDDSCDFPVYCHAAAIASQIILVQSSLKIEDLPEEQAKVKINTLEHVNTRKRREEQIKHYGAYRLQLLEARCHRVAVQKLLTFLLNMDALGNTLLDGELSNVTRLINFTIRLMVGAIGDEDRTNFVDLFTVQKREILAVQMERLIGYCVDRVDFEQKDGTEGYLKAIESAVELVSRLMWTYYANDFMNFFGSQKTILWKTVTSILRSVFGKVVQPWLAAKNREKVDKNVQAVVLEFACLSLNVSSASGITFTDVKHKLGQERIATLEGLSEWNPRQKGVRPEILLNMDALAKLKLNEKGFDTNNLQRAAYIINSSDVVYRQIKDLIINMVKTAKAVETQKKEAERRLELANTRSKRLEALDKRPVSSAGPSYADRMKHDVDDKPSTSSAHSKDAKMACEGIFMKTTLLTDFTLPRKNWEDLLFGKLVEVYDFESAYAYMLLLANNSDEGRRKLGIFLQHLRNLLDSSDDQLVEIDGSEPFLSLNWMPTVLSYLGYVNVKGQSEETWFAALDGMARERAIACNVLEEYLPSQREIALKLDTTFREVKGDVTEATYGQQTLPGEFFTSQDMAALEALKKRTVVELISQKRSYAELLRREKFDYILVRVEVSSRKDKVTTSRRVYQAVFNQFMPLSSVVKSLHDSGIAVSSLQLKPELPPLDVNKTLRDIGSIALYLYGY